MNIYLAGKITRICTLPEPSHGLGSINAKYVGHDRRNRALWLHMVVVELGQEKTTTGNNMSHIPWGGKYLQIVCLWLLRRSRRLRFLIFRLLIRF